VLINIKLAVKMYLECIMNWYESLSFLFFYGSYMAQRDSRRENNITVKRPGSSFISQVCTTHPRRNYWWQ